MRMSMFESRLVRRVQPQRRLLKLMISLLALISTMTVPPQATMAAFSSPTNARITVQTDLSNGQRLVTIRYSFSPRAGGLSVAFVRLGFDGWKDTRDLPATREQYDLSGVVYSAKLALPAHVRVIDFAFSDGARWDNNNGADYHALPAPWTPAWAGNLEPNGGQPLHAPAGTPVEIRAQYYQPGVTDALAGPNFNDDVIAELWYSVSTRDGGAWRPAPMQFLARAGNNHQYVHWFATGGLPAGTVVRFTCRFSANGGATWRWCDTSAHGDGKITIQ